MGFIRVKGVEGLLYVPDGDGGKKKHPCRDCHYCQWCSDTRCSLCLDQKPCGKGCGPKGKCSSGQVKSGRKKSL